MYFWLKKDKIIFSYPNTVGFNGFSRILVDYQVYLTASAQTKNLCTVCYLINLNSQRELVETVRLSTLVFRPYAWYEDSEVQSLNSKRLDNVQNKHLLSPSDSALSTYPETRV